MVQIALQGVRKYENFNQNQRQNNQIEPEE
ncbi:hypothetical protein PMI38_02741, partial [Pseudomonas sp. GM84]